MSPTSSPSISAPEELTSHNVDNIGTTHDRSINASSQKEVRRHYLSLVGIALLLTILTPRSKLWMSSSSCENLAEKYSSSQQAVNSTLYDGHDNFSARNLGDSSDSSEQHDNDTSSCAYYGSLNTQVLLVQMLWTIALVVSFNRLQGSDPGVLTKEIMERLNAEEDEENSPNTVGHNDGLERRTFLEQSPTPSSSPSSPLDLDTTSDNNISQNMVHSDTLYRSTRRKYCDKCQFYPPLRSHHCSTCNACIATFDHHCHFLGTCIGERNHWRFWIFVVLNVVAVKGSLDIVSSSSLTLRAFVHNQGSSSVSNGISDDVQLGLGTAVKIIAQLYMYPIFFVASTLLVIHTLLAIGNYTTFEFTKGAEHIDYLRGTRVMDFPFGRDGLFHNMSVFFRRDDVYQSLCLRSKENLDCDGSKEKSMSDRWVPIVWKMPEFIDRESAQWWNHPLENKYWKCC